MNSIRFDISIKLYLQVKVSRAIHFFKNIYFVQDQKNVVKTSKTTIFFRYLKLVGNFDLIFFCVTISNTFSLLIFMFQ